MRGKRINHGIRILVVIAFCVVVYFIFFHVPVQDSGEGYVFDGETCVEKDGRTFVLEDIPENIAEEIVVKDFLFSITGEIDKKYSLVAEDESGFISIENEKRNFKEGLYTQSYFIHKVTTLTEGEYLIERTEDGEYNPDYYHGVNGLIKRFKLIEYGVVNIHFTIVHSEKLKELGPQWGNGTYSMNFLVGTTLEDTKWKIYDFGGIEYLDTKFDYLIQIPSQNPIETVRSAIENIILKDYTIKVEVENIEIDEAETALQIEHYTGSDLARARGWSDEYLKEHLIVVKAGYNVEFDHIKTFRQDGYIIQDFYLTRDTKNGRWSVVDSTTP